jgi:hypothetical protein
LPNLSSDAFTAPLSEREVRGRVGVRVRVRVKVRVRVGVRVGVRVMVRRAWDGSFCRPCRDISLFVRMWRSATGEGGEDARHDAALLCAPGHLVAVVLQRGVDDSGVESPQLVLFWFQVTVRVCG